MTAPSRLIAVALATLACAGCGGDPVSTTGSLLSDAGVGPDAGATSSPKGAIEGPLFVHLQNGRLEFSWDVDQFLFHCLKISQGPGEPAAEFVDLCTPTKGQAKLTLGDKPGQGGVDFAWSGVKPFERCTAARSWRPPP